MSFKRIPSINENVNQIGSLSTSVTTNTNAIAGKQNVLSNAAILAKIAQSGTESNIDLSAITSNTNAIQSLASGSPKGTYATLSALQTAFPTGTTGIYVVAADGNWYYWNGSAWTAGGVYQSTGIANDTVTVQKAKFITKSVNLFNLNDPSIVYNNYLSQTNVVTSASDYYISHPIYVSPGDTITLRYIEQQGGGCFDINGNFLSKIGTSSGTASPYTFTVPVNTSYIKFNGRMTQINNDMVVFGSSYPGTYSSFYNKLSTKLMLDPANVPNGFFTKPMANFIIPSANLFNKNDPGVSNGYYIGSNGTLVANADYSCSHKISCKNGDVIRRTISLSESLNGALYDVNGNWLATIPNVTLNNGVFEYTVNNAQARYFALNMHWNATDNINNFMITVDNLLPSSYVPYYFKLDENFDFNDRQKAIVSTTNNNPIYGKTVLYDGDSICYGAGYTGGYPSIIGTDNSMTTVNYAVSGATIAGNTHNSDGSNRHWVCRNVVNMQSVADYIIFEGGINDYWNNVPLGAITNSYTSTFDDTTFYGALESLFSQAVEKWKGVKIGFIITHKIYNTFSIDGSATYFEKYRNAIIAVCNKWSIPYLDLFNLSGANTGLTDINDAYFKIDSTTGHGDYTHPNEQGYRAFYVPKIESWMKTL